MKQKVQRQHPFRPILGPLLITVVLETCLPLFLLLYDSLQHPLEGSLSSTFQMLDLVARGAPVLGGWNHLWSIMPWAKLAISALPLLVTGVVVFFSCRALVRRGQSVYSGVLVCFLADLCFLGALLLVCQISISAALAEHQKLIHLMNTTPPGSDSLKDLGVSVAQADAQYMHYVEQGLSHGLMLYLVITLAGLLLLGVGLGGLGVWKGREQRPIATTFTLEENSVSDVQAHTTQLANQKQLGVLRQVYQSRGFSEIIVRGMSTIVLLIIILVGGRLLFHIGGTGLFLTVCAGIIGTIGTVVVGTRSLDYQVYLYTNGLIGGSIRTTFNAMRWEEITRISSKRPQRLLAGKKIIIVLWRHLQNVDELEQIVQDEVKRARQI